MEQEGACLVFCSEAKAKELLSSQLIHELETLFHTSIQYQTGAFVIQRREMSHALQQKCKQSLVLLTNTYSSTPGAQWFWHNGRSFTPYDALSAAQIEQAFTEKRRYLILEIRGKPYQIDIAALTQTDLSSRKFRSIVRAPLQTGKQPVWGYWTETGFQTLSPENGQILTQALQSRRPLVTLRVGETEMRADVARLLMRDESLKKEFRLGYQ